MASDKDLKTVGDHVTLQRGITYSGKLVGEPGPALLGLGSIEPGGGFRANKYSTFGGECPAKMMLKAGDIYVALKGATKDGSMVGSVAKLPEFVGVGRLTQDTARLDFINNNPEVKNHVYWVLRTPQYRQYCAGRVTGSASASFSREDFLSYPIPESTSYSRRLVAIFEAIEGKLELNRRMNQTLESIARAIFQSWFVDFDPVRAKAEGCKPAGMDATTAALFPSEFVDSKLGKIPKGWKIEQFKDHLTGERGLSYNGAGLRDDGSGMPMHNLNSIYEGGGYKHEGLKYYAGEYRDKHIVNAGEMIITNTEQGHEHRLIGFAAIVPSCYGQQGLFSHHIYRVRPNENSPFTSHYLVHLFNNRRCHQLIAGYSNGTSINMLPPDALVTPPIVVPPLKLIQKFCEFASTAYLQQESNIVQSRILASLRDSLLPRLLSGELPVTNAKKLQELTA